MTGKLRTKWLKLYECAAHIGALEPWEIFGEADKFLYMWKAKDKTLYFSFIAESAGRFGIACYDGEANYARARRRLTARNDKQEPTFVLQDAYICLWGNREDLSRPTYELIKELGLSFRGKGAWLYFQRYETGYEPVLPGERDLDLMIEAFGNLFMMVRAVREDSLDPQFDRSFTLARWYDPKARLYYTHPFRAPEPKVPEKVIKFRLDPRFDDLLKTPVRSSVWELDWSYMPTLMRDGDRYVFPRIVLCVDQESGLVLSHEMLAPSDDAVNAVADDLCAAMAQFGRPASIAICDDDLKIILEDLCLKAGVTLTVKKRLPALNTARNELLKIL